MSIYTITDTTTGRMLGTVTANTERGARIKASRAYETRYEWVTAHPATLAEVDAYREMGSGTDSPVNAAENGAQGFVGVYSPGYRVVDMQGGIGVTTDYARKNGTIGVMYEGGSYPVLSRAGELSLYRPYVAADGVTFASREDSGEATAEDVADSAVTQCDAPEAYHPGFPCAHPPIADESAYDAAEAPLILEAADYSGASIIPTDGLRAYAESLASTAPDAPELRCSYCGESVETYADAHDDAADAIYRFIEHTAFDHSGRADILTVQVSVLARVANTGA